MRENPLDKVLRLAGGVTRAYVHQVAGRPVSVRQYPTPHPAMPGQSAPAAPKLPAGGFTGGTDFGNLKVGQVIAIHNVRYRVLQANVPPLTSSFGVNTGSGTSTGSQGSGVNTTGGSSTGSQGAGVNTTGGAVGTVNQNPQTAALVGFTGSLTGASITNEIMQVQTGAVYYVSLPRNLPVQVVA